jgi:hypothetical protein
MMRILSALGFAVVGLAGAVTSNASVAISPTVTCSADSGKAFAPVLTAEDICARFKRTLGRRAEPLRVELRFSSKGMASAKASQFRKGRWKTFPLFEMAVMDRRFNTSDIDRLVGDVVRGIASAPKTGGN